MKGGLLLNRFLKGAGFYLLLFAIIIGIVQFSGTQTTKVEELEFSKVYKYLNDGNISRIDGHKNSRYHFEITIKESDKMHLYKFNAFAKHINDNVKKKIVKLNKSINEDINIIIPTKNLIELTKLYNNDDDVINMHIFNNKVIFKFDNIFCR